MGSTLKYKNIVFDCDSTLTKIEGLDFIARRHGLGHKVASITAKAMNGEITFEEALKIRLAMINLKSTDLDWLGQKYIEQVTHGARDLVNFLEMSGANVYIVSGGLRPAVEILANHLGVVNNNVYAICLEMSGENLIPEKDCPMKQEDGKKQILKKLTKVGPTVMIGDV